MELVIITAIQVHNLCNIMYNIVLYYTEGAHMKKIIIGFILGIMFSGVAYAAGQYTATKVDYKVYINGKQYDSTSKPVLNVGGNTYLPLRNAAEALNVPIKWDTANGRVELGTPLKDDTTTSTITSTVNDNVSITLSNIKFEHVPFGTAPDTSATIAITNNGNKPISFKYSDVKVNYKYKDSMKGKFKSVGDDLTARNQSLGYGEKGKAYPDIQPGETRKLNINFMTLTNVEYYIDWVSVTWKGQQEFSKVTIK